MVTQVDLQELVIERPSLRREGRSVVRRRNVMTRFILPLALLGGFVAVLGYSLGNSFWPAAPVTVFTVISSRSEVSAADTPLFQAAGWVEPRPQPVIVTALVEGIVDEMLVVEGQAVEPGQIVARLIRRDSEIALNRARANVRLREAEVAASRAALTAAESLYAEPLPLISALAEADAALAKIETELARLPTLIRAAEVKRDFSERELAGKSQVKDSIAAIAIQRVKSDLETARVQVDEHVQQTKSLERERLALTKRCDVLRRQLEIKVDETRRLSEAKAQLQVAEAQLEQSQADRDSAAMALERTEIRAKTAGHVLSLIAKPGSRLMGIDRAAINDASTVLTMYDPGSLQIRADVRLENVPRVLTGQPVLIETAVHPQPLKGRVLMATAMTDIQKNTLQVKVAIDNPPAVLKPDMLVQTTFLAPAELGRSTASLSLKLLVPQELVLGSGDAATIWVADQPSGTAKLRRIGLGSATSDGLVEVTAGLNVGDRLIVGGRESLVDGKRIRIVTNDHANGSASSPANPVRSP